MKHIYILILLISCMASSAYGSEDHGHEEMTGRTTIEAGSAEAMNIQVSKAGAAFVHQVISLTGKITLNKNRVAQVRARFPGIVRDVKNTLGDEVKKNQTLAIVESNESLQNYPVRSPIDGVIIGRNTNIGNTTEDEAMFVIADLKKLWAEFFVFSRDINKIKPGQPIQVKNLTDGTFTETQLTTLLPTAESASQTVVVRVVIDNRDDKWRAGMTVRGDVILSEREVPIAVKTNAIQRQGGSSVIYIKQGNQYQIRKVEIGQSDREWTEILSGLQFGETYVSANSFIIKADIAKSEAGHEH